MQLARSKPSPTHRLTSLGEVLAVLLLVLVAVLVMALVLVAVWPATRTICFSKGGGHDGCVYRYSSASSSARGDVPCSMVSTPL